MLKILLPIWWGFIRKKEFYNTKNSKMKNYTIKEIAEELNVSEQTIFRQIQTFSDRLKNPDSKEFTIDEDLKDFLFSDKEELGLLLLMQQSDRKDSVSRNEVMNALK